MATWTRRRSARRARVVDLIADYLAAVERYPVLPNGGARIDRAARSRRRAGASRSRSTTILADITG